MKNAQGFLSSLASTLHTALIILLPVFFLTTTQEFYSTNKFYLLGAGVLLLLAVLTVQFLVTKKVSWVNSPLDTVLIAFVILMTTSLLVASPNKIQALLNPIHGLAVFVFLTLLYFITVHFGSTSAENKKKLLAPFTALKISAAVVAVLAIVFFLNPLQAMPLPASLAYLKTATFTPLGGQLDLALFLGFFVVFTIASLFGRDLEKSYVDLGLAVLFVVAFCVVLYTLVKPIPVPAGALAQDTPKSLMASLPPLSISWRGALKTLEGWKTGLFGYGIDNFASVFTQVKPVEYNATPLWRVNFNEGRSGLLELWAEGGLLVGASFAFLLFLAVKLAYRGYTHEKSHGVFQGFSSIAHLLGGSSASKPASLAIRLGLVYLIVALLFFPASLLVFFILFLLLADLAVTHTAGRVQNTDLHNYVPVVGILVAIAFVAIAAASYFVARSYLAEFYFKNSLDALTQNNGQEVYTNMQQAILANPFIEKYHTSFSQLNLLIANNLASQPGKKQLTDADRQNITAAVQSAIAESKNAVLLNPQKASNWENLAVIYRNILNVAQGADAWTVSSFQRAIVLDPQNPIHRLNLGGVLYSLNNFKDSSRFFEQAASLKPDWANAHYNLAWASYQLKDYPTAVAEMENVLKLLDPNAQKADYQRAQKDLSDFKKKLPKEGQTSNQEATGSSQLQLPEPPAASVEPKLNVPEGEPPVSPTPGEEKEATPSGTVTPTPAE